jgi:tetratricopeptide (TPR) repeat protein
MKTVVLVALLGVPALANAAQAGRPAAPAATQPMDPKAEAYQQYLLAQRLEDAQDTQGAIAAIKKAMTLDARSAELPAALADLYLGLNQSTDASAAAEEALKLDASNRDAHRILGTIFAGAATSDARQSRQARQENLLKAIDHLEKAVVERSGVQAEVNLRAMLARLYILNSAYDRAIPLLAELVRQEPGWQDGASLLVDAYVSAGRTSDAIAWLQEAALNSPPLYSNLADLYGREQRWEEAAKAYEQALQVSTRSFDLRVRYASMLMNAGGSSNALRARGVLREAIQMRATDERALFLLANAERQTNDLDASESTARRLITQNAKNPRGYYALAEALEARQKYREVVDALAPAVVQFRGGTNAAFPLGMLLPHLGFSHLQLGEYDQAIAVFEEAQKLAPEDTTIAGFLIQSHVSAKRYPRAIELAKTARTAHPDQLRFARLESQALRESGRVDEGLAVLQDVLKQKNGDPEAHLALAQAYVDVKRGPQAVRVLQDAQLKFPSNPQPAFELGAVLERQRKYPDAEAAFKEALQRDPQHAPSLNYLGYMLAERGERLSESVGYIKKALEIEPGNGSYMDSLGWAYFKDGQLDLAEQNLRQAAAQLVTNAVVQDHYGDVLFRMGRFQEAIEAWNRALAGDTEDLDRGALDRKIRSARQKLPGK